MSLPPTMSGANSGKPPAGHSQDQTPAQPKLDHYPPPPPGPPPSHGQAATPGFNIPSYNPAAPSFAGPPSRADTDIYNAEDDEPAPQKPARPEQAQPAVPVSTDAAASPGPGKSKHFLASIGQKLTGGINEVAKKMGSEGPMPTKLELECEKAARILRAFCKEDVGETTADASSQNLDVKPPTRPSSSSGRTSPGLKTEKQRKNRTLIHISSHEISRSGGLAIFTAVRGGYLLNGAIGSGVIITRLPNGGWSAPSAIVVRTAGFGATAGADIFDCVVVFKSRKTLDPFCKDGSIRLAGGGITLAAGPVGVGGSLDFAATSSADKGKGKGKGKEGSAAATGRPPSAEAKPADDVTADPKSNTATSSLEESMISYVKSRGLYASINVSGTILEERKDENARFYGVKNITAAQVLEEDVVHSPPGAAARPWQKHVQSLIDAVRWAEGYRTGSGPNTPLDPPTTLMSQMRFENENPGAEPVSAKPAGSTGQAGTAPGSFPPPPPGPPPNAAPATANWKIQEAAAHGNTTAFQANSAASASFPPPPPGPPPNTNPNIGPAMVQWKAEEAAKEAAAASGQDAPPPPSYSEFDAGHPAPPPPHVGGAGPSSDLPPAYVDDGHVRPGVGDSKAGQH